MGYSKPLGEPLGICSRFITNLAVLQYYGTPGTAVPMAAMKWFFILYGEWWARWATNAIPCICPVYMGVPCVMTPICGGLGGTPPCGRLICPYLACVKAFENRDMNKDRVPPRTKGTSRPTLLPPRVFFLSYVTVLTVLQPRHGRSTR